MTQDFNFASGASVFENTGASDWGTIGANPVEVQEEQSFKTSYAISGYVAGRRNALTPDIDTAQAKEVFKDLLARKIAEHGGPFTVDRIKADGTADGTIEMAANTAYTKTNLRSLSPEDFDRLGKNVYRIDDKEARPEFLVLVNVDKFGTSAEVSEETDHVARTVNAQAKTTSEKGEVAVIKDKDLAQVMLMLNCSTVNIINSDAGMSMAHTIGRGMPYMRRSKAQTKTNNPKYIIRMNFLDENNKKVKSLGYLNNIVYAVNRSYVSDTRPQVDLIVNEDKMREVFPSLDGRALGVTVKKLDENMPGATIKEQQVIPYSEYSREYEAMGISEEMLERIRGGKSQSGIYDRSDIMKDFSESRQVFLESGYASDL